MTNTAVKNVGSVQMAFAAAAGNKAAAQLGQAGFQTVLNNQTQTQKETGSQSNTKKPDTGKDSVKSVQTKPGDSLKAKDAGSTQKKELQQAGNGTGSLKEATPDELEQAMEVLNTAAVQMMQQTADVLGISVEELQGMMNDLNMEPVDILNPAQLTNLLLQAAGAEDISALVTDESLYGTYQQLMGQLDSVLQESSQKLGVDAELMPQVVTQLQQAEPVMEQQTVNTAEDRKPAAEEETQPLAETGIQEEVPVEEQQKMPENSSAESKEHHAEEKGSNADNQLHHSTFLQHQQVEEFQPQAEQVAETTSPWDAETEDIMNQIMDYMKVQLKADSSNLEMQLHPASLGTVQVQIASKGGEVTAHFITQNEAVKAALESQIVQLKEQFEQQGIKVEAVEVTVQTHQFEENLEQGRGREQQGEPAKKSRVRKIDLNNPFYTEEIEEEDTLVADMMAANGNTVDYTA